MNFYQPCTVDGHHARLTMNNERVFLAVHAAGVDIVSEPFATVQSSGAGRARRVRLGERIFDIDFHDETNAARFSRVLAIRHDPYSASIRAAVPSHQPATLMDTGAAYPGSPHHRYHQYAHWVMVSSGALIALGFLDLVVGLILGLVLLDEGGGWVALAWLFFAVLGSAGPFCLACLARMVVYRDRAAATAN